MATPCVQSSRGISEPSVAEEPATPAVPRYECDACGESCTGIQGGAGLFIWTRGDEVRYEEPPLCEKCASEITIGALVKWQIEEDEEG
jgi:hypothetical protein